MRINDRWDVRVVRTFDGDRPCADVITARTSTQRGTGEEYLSVSISLGELLSKLARHGRGRAMMLEALGQAATEELAPVRAAEEKNWGFGVDDWTDADAELLQGPLSFDGG